jgi:hypothetical protein
MAFNLPSKLHFFRNLRNSRLPYSICTSNEVRFDVTSCYMIFKSAVIPGINIPFIVLKTLPPTSHLALIKAHIIHFQSFPLSFRSKHSTPIYHASQHNKQARK